MKVLALSVFVGWCLDPSSRIVHRVGCPHKGCKLRLALFLNARFRPFLQEAVDAVKHLKMFAEAQCCILAVGVFLFSVQPSWGRGWEVEN